MTLVTRTIPLAVVKYIVDLHNEYKKVEVTLILYVLRRVTNLGCKMQVHCQFELIDGFNVLW